MEPKEIALKFVEAFNRKDADALASLYEEDAINHQVAESPVKGRERYPRNVPECFRGGGDGVHR